MFRLARKPLPAKVHSFRSLGAVLKGMYDARCLSLMDTGAYPVPTHLLHRILKLIPLDQGMDRVLNGLMQLRMVAKLASQVLRTHIVMKTDRLQLDYKALAALIKERAEEFNVSGLTEDQASLAAYLIIYSSDSSYERLWTLDYPTIVSENLVETFRSLYERHSTYSSSPVSLPRETPTPGYEAVSITTLSASDVDVYNPYNDTVVKLSSSVFNSEAVRSFTARATGVTDLGPLERELSTVYNNELIPTNIAYMFLIDILWTMFTSPAFWDQLLPSRTKDDPAQNKTRADALDNLAGFCQHFLLFPTFFKYYLLADTYDALSTWMQLFPTPPASSLKDVEDIINPNDAFGAKALAKKVLSAIDTPKSDEIGTEIKGLPVELVSLFGNPDLVADIEKTIPEKVAASLSDLKEFAGTGYDYVLLSLALAATRTSSAVTDALFEGRRFWMLTDRVVSLVASATRNYCLPSVNSSLTSLFANKQTALVPKIPGVIHFLHVGVPDITGSQLGLPYGHALASTDLDRYLTREFIYKFGLASGLYKDYRALLGFNTNIAKRIQDRLTITYRGIAPSFLTRVTSYFDAKSMETGTRIEEMLEALTDESILYIRKALNDQVFRRKLATAISGGALLYHEKAKEGKELIPGFGYPYGVEYTSLASLQDIKTNNYIRIPSTDYYIVFLKRVPLPKTSFSFAEFYLDAKYHFFPGDPNQVAEVKGFGYTNDPTFSMSLFRLTELPAPPRLIHTNTHAYANDSVFMHLDPLLLLPEGKGEVLDSGVVEGDWKGYRNVSNVPYRPWNTYSSFGVSTGDLTDANPEADTTIIKDIVNKFDEEFEKADKESASQRRAGARPEKKIEEDIKKGINEGLDDGKTGGKAHSAAGPKKSEFKKDHKKDRKPKDRESMGDDEFDNEKA